MCIDKLADIANKYKNSYHSRINMKPVDVKSSTCIDFDKKISKEYSKFGFGDHNRISCNHVKTFLQKNSFQISLKKFL